MDEQPPATPLNDRRRFWPASPEALTETSRCPSCFTPLTSHRCGFCGLDVSVPLATELFAASQQVREAEEERQSIIDRMWSEQLADEKPATVEKLTTAAPVPTQTEVLREEVYEETPPAATVNAPVAPQTRRSGIQIFLLITGISLLAVTAVFFLLVAYFVATLEARVLLTAAASVAVFGISWLLKKRALPGTAEGVAAVAIALALIDLAIVRTQELFGSQALSRSLFAGSSLLFIGGVLLGFYRITRLRVASITLAFLIPTSCFFLAFAAMAAIGRYPEAWWVGFVAALATTLLASIGTDYRLEKNVLRIIGFAAGTYGLFPAYSAFNDEPYARVISYLVLATLWAAQLWALQKTADKTSTRHQLDSVFYGYSATLASLSLVLTPALASAALRDTELRSWLMPTTIALVLLGLTLTKNWIQSSDLLRAIKIGYYPVFVVFGISLLPVLYSSVMLYRSVLISPIQRWQLSVSEPLERFGTQPTVGMVLAIIFCSVIVSATLVSAKKVKKWCALPISLTALSCLSAALSGASILLIAIGLGILACGTIGALFFQKVRTNENASLPLWVTLALTILALYTLGYSSSTLWPITLTFCTLTGFLASYLLNTQQKTYATAMASGSTFTLLLIAMVGFGSWATLNNLTNISEPWYWEDPWYWVRVVAVVVLLTVPLARIGAHGEGVALRSVGIVASTVLLLSAVGGLFRGTWMDESENLSYFAVAGLTFIAILLWQKSVGVSSWSEKIALAFMGPVALSICLFFLPKIPGTLNFANTFVPLTAKIAIVLSAIFGALLLRAADSRRCRIAWNISVGLLTISPLTLSFTEPNNLSWLGVLMIAIVPMIWASVEKNRHIAWISLPLGAWSLWQFLSFRGVSEVEPYTVPLAGLLIGLSALTAFRDKNPTGAEEEIPFIPGRTLLLFSGLAIGLLPSALVATISASPLRAFILSAIGILLVAAALFGPTAFKGIGLRIAALGGGTATLLIVSVLRSIHELQKAGITGIQFEGWLAPALLALTAIAFFWSKRQHEPAIIARLSIPVALSVLALTETSAIVLNEYANLRSLLLFGVLACVHICSVWFSRAVTLGKITEWLSLCLMATLGILCLTLQRIDPFELVTLPLAFALITAGILRLVRNKKTRSWREMGPGLAVLLLPSLFADFGHNELWRIVGLGIICLALIVFALIRQLQAPLLLGGTTLIAHAVAQTWPWIQDAYGSLYWWVWLGIGGVLLIVLAATYEHRVRNLKTLITRISQLR